jgi:predicted RNA-binding protein with PIN domain
VGADGTDHPQLPDELLRSALQFAVTVAAAGRTKRPPEPSPAALRPYVRMKLLPVAALTIVRMAVDGDDGFRARVGERASEGVVDEIGTLWLRRPDGWRARAEAIARTVPAGSASKESKRREAAEAAAERSRRETAEAHKALERTRSVVADLETDRDALRAENDRLRAQIKELKAAAKQGRQGDATAAMLRDELAVVVEARDAALAQRAAHHHDAIDVERIRGLLSEALVSLGDRRKPLRTPVALPGKVHGNAEAAAEYVLRVPDVMVIVDGYNVAKLGWPALRLEQQRERCVAGAEQLAKRWGTELHIVFDGADIVGSHAAGRRMVRVSFSPEGVTADDVIRVEVRALDPARPVAVVTDDKAIINDVRAWGANHVSSRTFLELLRR